MGEPSRPAGAFVTVAAGTVTTPMRRVAAACLVGSAIEFYDFLIYGTAAALVFPTVFFPHLDPTVAMIASMGTFAAAFLSRPLGAAVFGYFGDRLGRKKTLIATLLIMAVSTVSVGLVPSTAAIGMAAPLILVGLRLLQGFAVGGEWAGSALLSAEYAPAGKRGLYGMFTLLGGGTAGVLSSLTFLGVNVTIGENSPAFLQWGWRLPFLVSAALVGIALYVRLNIDETPVFAEEKAHNLIPSAPIAEVLRLQRREVALAAGSMMTAFGFVYMGNTYLVMYAHSNLGYSRGFIWSVGVLVGLVSISCVALSATLSDRVGRRRMMLLGWTGCLAWSFVVIPLIDTAQTRLVRGRHRRDVRHHRDRLGTHGGLRSRTVRHPLPLQRLGAGAEPRRRGGRRPAAAARRDVAGHLRQLGDRSDAGHPRPDQPGVHLSTPGNQRDGVAPVGQLACRSSLRAMP